MSYTKEQADEALRIFGDVEYEGISMRAGNVLAAAYRDAVAQIEALTESAAAHEMAWLTEWENNKKLTAQIEELKKGMEHDVNCQIDLMSRLTRVEEIIKAKGEEAKLYRGKLTEAIITLQGLGTQLTEEHEHGPLNVRLGNIANEMADNIRNLVCSPALALRLDKEDGHGV